VLSAERSIIGTKKNVRKKKRKIFWKNLIFLKRWKHKRYKANIINDIKQEKNRKKQIFIKNYSNLQNNDYSRCKKRYTRSFTFNYLSQIVETHPEQFEKISNLKLVGGDNVNKLISQGSQEKHRKSRNSSIFDFWRKFSYDNSRTWLTYQKVNFTIQSNICDKFKLSVEKLSENRTGIIKKINLQVFQNKSLMNLFVQENMKFGVLHLNQNYNYFKDGKLLKDEDILGTGNNWFSFRCRLPGGDPNVKFPTTQVELYVIYTSMDKLISLEKLDLIGLSSGMEEFVMMAIDYKTSCQVKILEVVGREKEFWNKNYKRAKDFEVSDLN
jgi:hypothetical protein